MNKTYKPKFEPTMVSINDASRIMGISTEALRKRLARGMMPVEMYKMPGGRLMLDYGSLMGYIHQNALPHKPIGGSHDIY